MVLGKHKRKQQSLSDPGDSICGRNAKHTTWNKFPLFPNNKNTYFRWYRENVPSVCLFLSLLDISLLF